MFVSVIHHITDSDRFFSMVSEATGKIPPDLRLAQYFASKDRSTAVCVWDVPSIVGLQQFLEPLSKGNSRNEYLEVDTSQAVGLPALSVA